MGIVFCGCSNLRHFSNKTDKYETKWLNVECFQTLDNVEEASCCLARDKNSNVYFIINITCPTGTKGELYYDGKQLMGKYVFVGTYSYISRGGDKTVQAYMPIGNYRELYDYSPEYLKKMLDIELSYNAVK